MSTMNQSPSQSQVLGTELQTGTEPPREQGPPADDASLSAEGQQVESSAEAVTEERDHKDGAVRPKKRRAKRKPKGDASELRLQGRRALCKHIPEIAGKLKKTIKLRILNSYLPSTRGLSGDDMIERLKSDVAKIAAKDRIISELTKLDPDVNRRTLKHIILEAILLQEETYSLEESRLEEKVMEYEKDIVKRAQKVDYFDQKKHDPQRWHHYDTYRIVLEAAWRFKDGVSEDEANLLAALREHLSISLEEHWIIGAYLKRFPKHKCVPHSRDEINEARKELHRQGLLWSYRDESNQNIDVIPFELATIIRKHYAHLELQRTNFRRMLQHDCVKLSDIRDILIHHNMDRYGNKPELSERLVNSDLKPSTILDHFDRSTLSEMCGNVGLKSSGNKPTFIRRLIEFYDDLSFVERTTQDEREEWFNNYELLASRAYADLKAKKLISKDLDIEHRFERATDFLFERKLHLRIDKKKKGAKVDGRIFLQRNQTILWDCKSVEKEVNLQDFLDDQFDRYLVKERESGLRPLAFLVVGPSFTPQSVRLAHQYKARTNWDIALITAEALKYLADQWSSLEPEKPFPIKLLNRTELVDIERAEYLLSLA